MNRSWKLTAIRSALRGSHALSPHAAAWLADRLFCTPPSSTIPNASRKVMAAARPGWSAVDGDRIRVWRWGRGPTVALLHGWGSRAARMTVFVQPLLDNGFSVVAFDAPAHGESEGTLGSGIQQARALRAVTAQTPLHGVVAHSLGAAATILALREGLDLRRAVFIAPPADIELYLRRFRDTFGLGDDVTEQMRRRIATRLQYSWSDLDFARYAAEMDDVGLLVFHDKLDREVPPENGEKIATAWPGARLIMTEGLGHNRIARDPAVVSEAVQFLGRDLQRRSGAGVWLEQELFERDRRPRPIRSA